MAATAVFNSPIQIWELISQLARLGVRTGFLLRKKHYSKLCSRTLRKILNLLQYEQKSILPRLRHRPASSFLNSAKIEDRRHKELAGCCIIWSLQRVLALSMELNLGEFDFPFPAPIPLLTFYSRNQLGLDQPLIKSSQWGALMHFICSYCS